MIGYTDAAMEIVELCQFFGRIPDGKRNVVSAVDVLVDYFGEDQDQVYLALKRARQRFTDFADQLNDMNDPLLDQVILDQAKNAALGFVSFTDLRKLRRPWSEHSKVVGNQQSLSSIMAVSMAFRARNPIKRLSEKEISEIRDYLSQENLASNLMKADAPNFLKIELAEAIKELLHITQFVPLYGFEKIGVLSKGIEWKNRAVAHIDKDYKETSTFTKIAAAVAIAGAVYTFPAEMLEATEKYKTVWESLSSDETGKESHTKDNSAESEQ